MCHHFDIVVYTQLSTRIDTIIECYYRFILCRTFIASAASPASFTATLVDANTCSMETTTCTPHCIQIASSSTHVKIKGTIIIPVHPETVSRTPLPQLHTFGVTQCPPFSQGGSHMAVVINNQMHYGWPQKMLWFYTLLLVATYLLDMSHPSSPQCKHKWKEQHKYHH